MSPERLCLEARCSSPARYRGRCQHHAALHDQATDRQGRSVYQTKRWRLTRRRKLYLDPLCERCGQVATDVHHKHGVETVTWAIEALESLCHSCHSRQTRLHQLEGATNDAMDGST